MFIQTKWTKGLQENEHSGKTWPCYIFREQKCGYLSCIKSADLLLEVTEQNNPTKGPDVLYLGWMYSLWPLMKGPAYRCASAQPHWRPTHTHTHACIHSYTGRAASRLSNQKIIRHQNDFSCFFVFFVSCSFYSCAGTWETGWCS